jgi:hypothetical protein
VKLRVKSCKLAAQVEEVLVDNINPDNLAAAKKRQNKITEYRKMLLAWNLPIPLKRSNVILQSFRRNCQSTFSSSSV